MIKRKQQVYGVVEGFFSQPLPMWTSEKRLSTLKFISSSAKEINTYFYCPKQDVYITDRWDSLYPKNKILELKKAIKYCNKNGIRFVYGLNPKTSLSKRSKATTIKVLRKFKQLQSIGCNNFAVLFDDVPLAYDVIDRNLTSQSLGTIRNIVDVTNDVYRNIEGDINEFWFCGPDYFIVKKTFVTEEMSKINYKIPFIWTGSEIFTSDVQKKDFEAVSKVVGQNRKIIWWSNYPVNDCEQNIGMYNLGAFQGPSNNILNKLYGIVVNPMREPYISFPFYITFSNYLYNPKRYDKNRAWSGALSQTFGMRCKIYQQIFSEFTQRNPTDDEPKWLYKRISKNNLKENKRLIMNWTKILVVANNSLSNKSKYKFLKELKNIFLYAKSYILVLKKVSENKKIDIKLLKTIPFPTNPREARYYPEIFKIVKSRLFLLSNRYVSTRIFNKYDKLNSIFTSKYQGSKKLQIKPMDQSRYTKVNKEIINFENICYIAMLNDPSLKANRKIKLLSIRQNINRFFV